jgi:hypothetical protein
MSVYTVLEPQKQIGSAVERADRFVFIREGFTWSAFLFAPLWLVCRRLWLAFFAYAVLVVAVEVALRFAGVGPGGQIAVGALIALLVGLEAANLRRWTLVRRGWQELGAVIADDRDEAERRFFDAWVETAVDTPAAGPLMQATSIIRPPSPHRRDVVGLFPEPSPGR